MLVLKEILKHINFLEIHGDDTLASGYPVLDSRKVKPGSTFFAIKGTQTDGHLFIPAAIEKGAKIIFVTTLPESPVHGITYVKVKDTAEALATYSKIYFNNPSSRLKLIGITGTNGKTSTATFLYRFLQNTGHKTGLISTIKILIDKEELAATHTTPDIITVNEILLKAIEKGCSHVVMEVSSHALVQHRVTGLEFDLAIFTNITRDHLDYHKTFKEYCYAKKKLFDNLPASATALVNIDDSNAGVMIQNSLAKKKTYGLKNPADYKARILEMSFQGSEIDINGIRFISRLSGEFNIYNLLAVFAAGVELGFNPPEVARELSLFSPVEGRFEFITDKNNITAIVDYAHTPDALENVLKAIRSINKGKGQIITVFGCGGNRDKGKRPIMGKIAAQYSDQVIITSDNPRFENPGDIIKDIEKGIPDDFSDCILSIENRKQAIKTAVKLANKDDIILIAGKGHEKYQEIQGIRHPFSDFDVVKTFLNL